MHTQEPSLCNFSMTDIILPSVFSKRIQDAIEGGELGKPENRLAFIREAVAYFESQLPCPTAEQYAAISKKFCIKYPALRNAHHTNFWVCACVVRKLMGMACS